MVGLKRWWGVGALLVAMMAMMVAGGQWVAAAVPVPAVPAETDAPAMTWGDPHVFLAVDTTKTMGPELAALAEVWDDSDIFHLEDVTYHPWRFTDTVLLRPPTGSSANVQAWLNSLQTEGGGACPDASFQALIAAARLEIRRDSGDAILLLLTDSAPQGGRAALGRVVNRALEAGVRVYPVQSEWCAAGTPLPMEAMKVLGRMTGGSPLPAQHGTGLTHTLMALNLMAFPDDLIYIQDLVGQGETDQYELEVEGGLDDIILQVDDDDKKDEKEPEEEEEDDDWWINNCLTCVRQIAPLTPLTHTFRPPLTATVRLPNGTILGPGSPGVTFLSTAYGLQMKISNPNAGQPLPAGTWTVRVTGQSSYALRVAADADLKMSYLGRHSVPAGQPFPVVVSLLLPAVQGRAADAPVELDAFFLQIDKSTPKLAEFKLRDDGLSNDGAAGDGIFGGVATLPRGAYRLAVQGQLDDGTPFQRMEPAPIRARPFRLSGPADGQADAGTTVTHTFTLTNDADTSTSYDLLAESEQGWAQTSSVPLSVTLDPGEVWSTQVRVEVPAGAAPGQTEELTLTAVGADLLESETALVRTAVAGSRILLPMLQR